jgi:ubiquinone/menaquinone biosynthesis C-methylase UbiE
MPHVDDVTGTARESMYGAFAEHYDHIYSYKDTAMEVKFIQAVMRKHGVKGKAVLDVACGTGRHAAMLARKGFTVVGIDKNEGMLRVARRKVSKAAFHRGDMKTFHLPRRFAVILCMFTSINYNTRMADLVKTLRNFERHLSDGGIIVFDAPFRKRKGVEQSSGDLLDKDTAILYVWRERGLLTIGDIYWIIRRHGRTPKAKGASVVLDRHILRLYRLAEIKDAIRASGMTSEIY